jgi:hypothetical protein
MPWSKWSLDCILAGMLQHRVSRHLTVLRYYYRGKWLEYDRNLRLGFMAIPSFGIADMEEQMVKSTIGASQLVQCNASGNGKENVIIPFHL